MLIIKTLIEYSSNMYPERLRYIKKPPSRLYVEGNPEILNEVGIAVIGSRTNTQYGEKMCKKFVKKLVEYNVNIISGLAYGIDSIAHKTCLKNVGKTIAVLPSGLENIYPKENKQLAEAIIDNGGAVVSEYENNVKADSKKFLERNRIVAGLGIGTLVVEAGHRSGTSVTARYTEETGKPVFCIPSSLENIKGKTTNELIQNGAKLVTETEDILIYYPNITFSPRRTDTKKVYLDIPTDLIDVYKVINNVPQDVNEIARKTKLSISDVNYKVMMLQLEDRITELSGQRFIIKEDEDT
ncbi:MAG: DNA-processing protein DprA [Clostridia bacterium]|nr:DNA-processing protein DprA [Clostridia bacterium]